jgi:hypothetical protein
MASRTERILSYLPSTFGALPRPTALYSFVDAYGNELRLAENSLAGVMSAHWVDFADRNAELINDLACMARLYGLAPRGAPRKATCGPLSSEESVAEFREHLKRYVRTFLDGTVTVQGILRVVAEVLGLHIADDYAEMDTWWTRDDDGLTTIEPRGDDAARSVFGFESFIISGEPVSPARIYGDRDLSGGIDLSGAFRLRLSVDAAAPVELDLAARLGRTSGITLEEISRTINDALGAAVAIHDGRYLTLQSPTTGSASELQVHDVNNDAAPLLLGLAPNIYAGRLATTAQITGLIDLKDGVDLSEERYLRLSVDGKFLEEIDCGGTHPEHQTLDEIKQTINQAFGFALASHDGHFLTLTSPSKGPASSIGFQPPAAQDARQRLFGQVALFISGEGERPAEVVGTSDLSSGADLSLRSKIRVALDGQPALVIDCAGVDAAHTRLGEIVSALNNRLGIGIASHDGHFIHLRSPTPGPQSSIVFEPLPPDQNAIEIIFGIRPREVRGYSATRARMVGQSDLRHGLDAAALNHIRIAIDGGPPIEIDLRRGAVDQRAVTLEELRAAINDALGAEVASHDDHHLILTSTTTGSASSVALEPLLITRRRRFVTRAFITDEPAQAVFGFITRQARGKAATSAYVAGKKDLSRGVDLRDANFLRLTIDDWPAVDIDCSGVRPRATTLDEIVNNINSRLAQVNVSLSKVARASANGQNLVLSSPTTGSHSRIAFSEPRAIDALGVLLGVEPQKFFGSTATGVRFVSGVELGEDVDLSAASHIKLRVDDAGPVEINCANSGNPAHTRPSDIVSAINAALGKPFAQQEASHVALSSLKTGAESRIEFTKPDAPDATEAIFGIRPPREYHGKGATAARVIGLKDLQAGADLRVAHFLNLSVDGHPPLLVDCAARATDIAHTLLDDIVLEINTAFNLPIASHDGKHLALASLTEGVNSQLELLASTGNDAREKLLGPSTPETKGRDDTAAIIEGTMELLAPLDLSERRLIRISLGDVPVDIDIAGSSPAQTTLEEIVERINNVFPQMASATPENHLRLSSDVGGEDSIISLLPMRALEMIEFPPAETSFPPLADDAASEFTNTSSTPPPSQKLRHGDRWAIFNNGATDTDVEIELSAPQGTFGAELVNRSTAQRVKLLSIIRPGERVRVWRDAAEQLRAEINSSDGMSRAVPLRELIVGPLGTQMVVPFTGEQQLTDVTNENPATLQLNNPLSKSLVLLRALRSGTEGNRIRVSVTEVAAPRPELGVPSADGVIARLIGHVRRDDAGFHLANAERKTIARLRPGPEVEFEAHLDRVVAARGPLHPSEEATPLLLVQEIEDLFDVTIGFAPEEGEPLMESFTHVSIGTGEDDAFGLVWQINHSPAISALVRAEVIEKSKVLRLPQGKSVWAYFDCAGARFDAARFDMARFAGGYCTDRATFNFSRFSAGPGGAGATVFALAPVTDPPVEVRLRWMEYQPGAFIVNLPLDLPENFGARFNSSRLGMSGEELFETVFTEPEPEQNPDHIVTRINHGPRIIRTVNEAGEVIEQAATGGSALLSAEVVERVPPGVEVVTIPFRKPRKLSGGTEDAPATIYLAERDVPQFIKLSALKRDARGNSISEGAWGNSISVAVRKAGPARFDMTVSYAGARFENARQTALGGRELPALIEEILRPNPAGVLQAKAAGVKAQVSRDRAQSQS